MNDKRLFILANPPVRSRAIEAIKSAPEGMLVELKPAKRSLDQNAAQWPILEAFSTQLRWPVNAAMVHLEPEEWKQILTAAFRQETVRMTPGLNGGVVMLGERTSRMSKAEFSEWLEFLHATAADRGVNLDSETQFVPGDPPAR